MYNNIRTNLLTSQNTEMSFVNTLKLLFFKIVRSNSETRTVVQNNQI